MKYSMYDKNGLEFLVGRRIKNIDPRKEPGANFGEKGIVTNVVSGVVYVEYDNGDTGNAAKPEKYYQILNEGRISKAYQSKSVDRSDNCLPCAKNGPSSTPERMNNVISSAMKAVKRALMNSTERDLIDAGLKDECGTFTATATELLNQAAAEADVASGTDSVLVSAASAILADRKAKKDADR